MDTELSDMLAMYKKGTISGFSLTSELFRRIVTPFQKEILLVTKASGASNGSYVFIVVPHKSKKSIHLEIMIDDTLLKAIPESFIDGLIESINRACVKVTLDYSNYLRDKAGAETTKSDCLKLIMGIEKICIGTLSDSMKKELTALHVDLTAPDQIIKAINDDEKFDIVMEKASVMNIIPEPVACYIDSIMATSINARGNDEDDEELTVNKYFDYLSHFTTEHFDPYRKVNLPDKTMYEEYEESLKSDSLDELNESLKTGILKFVVKFIPEGKLRSTTKGIYDTLKGKFKGNELALKEVEKYNPEGLDKKGLVSLYRSEIDMADPKVKATQEAKANAIINRAKSHSGKPEEGKEPLKEDVTVLGLVLSGAELAILITLVCSVPMISSIVTALGIDITRMIQARNDPDNPAMESADAELKDENDIIYEEMNQLLNLNESVRSGFLKFLVNFLTENKLTSILSRVYLGARARVRNNHDALKEAEQFNPSGLTKKEKRALLKKEIDMADPKSIYTLESRAKDSIDKAKAKGLKEPKSEQKADEPKDNEEGKAPIKEEAVVATATFGVATFAIAAAAILTSEALVSAAITAVSKYISRHWNRTQDYGS